MKITVHLALMLLDNINIFEQVQITLDELTTYVSTNQEYQFFLAWETHLHQLVFQYPLMYTFLPPWLSTHLLILALLPL